LQFYLNSLIAIKLEKSLYYSALLPYEHMSLLSLPKIGLGTWQLTPDQCKKSVLNAIKIGYRLIDTAQMYENEEGVGAAIAESPIPREELVIATKINVFNNDPGKLKKSMEISLKKLQLRAVDILYVHWPAFSYKPSTTLKAMSELVDLGKVRYLAVSNFTPKLLENALAICDKPIIANQVEHHPLLHQVVLLEYCNRNNMKLVAYSPLGRGNLMEISELVQVAKKYGVSVSQVCLAWEMDHGALPIPKSTSIAHLQDNFNAQSLKLDQEDIKLIDSLQPEHRFLNPPLIHPKW
jgi:2,5-diketo-D-gluconate reductase B